MDGGDTLVKLFRTLNEGVQEGMRNMNPRSILSLVVAFFTLSSADKKDQVVDLITKGIQKEIAAVKNPIDQTITFVGSSQCKNVKKLVGVSYEQLKGVKEPDLNQLALFYRTRSVSKSVNISEAAGWLRSARQYEPETRLIIFVHGFTDNPQGNSFTNISNSFLQTNDVQSVLALDGSSLIRWLYLRSSTYVRFMGQKLAEVLAVLVKFGQDPSLIHIIGHSLGAHIAGFTGKTFLNVTGKPIGRISGLDPAGPCFSDVDAELRLKKTDATFVDVIHTDAGVYGIKDAVGHVDFYPNSGSAQPGCVLQTCSHSRAWQLYAESVLRRDAFPAQRCERWEDFKKNRCEPDVSYMGYNAAADARGQYYLRTGDKYPYGLGAAGLKHVGDDGIVQSIGNILG